MKRIFVIALLLAACRKPVEDPPAAEGQQAAAAVVEEAPPPEVADLVWSSVSESGVGALAEVRQSATARGRCRVTAALGAQKLWSVDACIATRKEMRFVSPDGIAVVVIDPLPDSDETKLGALWREGRHVVDLTPASMRLPQSATRTEGGKLHWLGPADPKAIPEGVQVQLVNGSSHLIRFDGRGIEAPPPPQSVQAVAGPAASETCAPCSYTDSAGVYHVVESATEIPPEYRKQAGRIRGTVQRADASPTQPPAQAASPASGRAASSEPVMTEQQAIKALREEARQAPVQRPPDPNRNSVGENFIEYNNRITGTLPQTSAPKATCIDNSGASVPCSQIGMQVHY